MADDKKKNALFGKILARKHSTAISAEAEEQESKAEKSIETSDDDYTPEWLFTVQKRMRMMLPMMI